MSGASSGTQGTHAPRYQKYDSTVRFEAKVVLGVAFLVHETVRTVKPLFMIARNAQKPGYFTPDTK